MTNLNRLDSHREQFNIKQGLISTQIKCLLKQTRDNYYKIQRRSNYIISSNSPLSFFVPTTLCKMKATQIAALNI